MTDKIKFIDLFAGTGGFTEAFKCNDVFECVYANDMIKESKIIYQLKNPNHLFELKNLHNVNESDIPSHDILCGGFPCQPFSVAGNLLGFDDERSNVFWKIIKIIKFHSPKVIILENVKNLLSHDKGNSFKIIKENLEKLDYFVKYCVLDTSKITHIPHHRERIYILCFKDKKIYDKFNFDFTPIESSNMKTFLENNIDDKYYYTNRFKMFDTIKQNVTKHDVLYQYRRHYVRENKSGCCPTLTCNMGSGGHNVPLLLDDKGIRKITPRECFNFQGFPSSYKLPNLSDSALYKLAGNAISVPVVKLLVDRLLNSIFD